MSKIGIPSVFLIIGGTADIPAWCVTDARADKREGNTIKTVQGIFKHIDCCSACTDYGETCHGCTWYYSTKECMLKSVGINVTYTSWPRGEPSSPSPPPPSPKWFGAGKVQDKSFWRNMRGIGFSPANDRGPAFSKEHPPQISRLHDALRKVAQNGFNFIRTWHTNDYQELMLQYIQDMKLDIKVQLGVDISNDAQAIHLIDKAAQIASKYPDLILSLSLGNENIKSVSATSALTQASYAKLTYGVPVTYDFTQGTVRWEGSDVAKLCAGLDYLSVHNYGNWFSHRNDPSYTSDQYVADVRQYLQAVQDKVGHLGKPIILGETGWQSRMYKDSSVEKLQDYYNKITKYVYQTGDPNIQSMAYFELCDEQWKGGDDAWGLYEQGNADMIGDSHGNPKFKPINVDEVIVLNSNAISSASSLTV